MIFHVNDLMSAGVVIARPDHTIDYVRRQMRTLEINAVPVADPDGKPVGIVRSSDLRADLDPKTPCADVMTRDVPTINQEEEVAIAARQMINTKTYHLIVTHKGKISGIISVFDFLELLAARKDEPDFKTGVYQVPADLQK
jgi:predicted transcriptional regulator